MDQQCPRPKISSQIGYLILPAASTIGLSGSARPISNATVHYLFLGYICNIRTSGFLCGLLVCCSLGPSHPCAPSHLKIHTHRSEGREGMGHRSDDGLGLELATLEDFYSHVRRGGREKVKRQREEKNKSRRVSKRPRFEVERGGNTGQYIQTCAHTHTQTLFTHAHYHAHNFYKESGQRPACAARSPVTFPPVLDDL